MPLTSLRQWLFHILIALTLFAGFVPLLLDARKLQAEYMHSVEQRLQLLAVNLQKQLQTLGPPVNEADIAKLLQAVLPDDSYGVQLLYSGGSVVSRAGLIKSVDISTADIAEAGFSHWHNGPLSTRLPTPPPHRGRPPHGPAADRKGPVLSQLPYHVPHCIPYPARSLRGCT